MTGNVRSLIVAGVVGVGGLLLGADRSEAQGYGPGPSFNLNLGISNGYGPGYGRVPDAGYGRGPSFGHGYGHGHGHGHGHGYGPAHGYGRGPGFGYGPSVGRPGCPPGGDGRGFGYPGRGTSYYSETTVITTVVSCDRCGGRHDRHHRCGGPPHGGYGPPPFPPRHRPW